MLDRREIGWPKAGRIADPAAVEAARKRDGICLWHHLKGGGCWGDLNVHHIDTRGSGGPDDLTNLITLCQNGAHNKAHLGLISKADLRAILSQLYGYVYEEDNG